MADQSDTEAVEKLKILETTSNGFEIAEADWKLRGPGDLLGTAQSGLPPIRIGNLVRDTELMHQARGTAFVLLEKDPSLSQPENLIYKRLMVETRRMELSHVS